MKRVTEKSLADVAKQEIKEWKTGAPQDWARIILACFIYRLVHGEPIESLFKQPPVWDYEI